MNRKLLADQNCDITNEACRQAQALLSEYVDNTLSARQMWDLEKHLSSCSSCSTQAQQMQVLVELVRYAPRLDTGDDFMAKLHTRLDGLEPELARSPSIGARVRDWAAGIQDRLRLRATPTVGLALALACAAVIVVVPLLPKDTIGPSSGPVKAAVPQQVQQALDRHVADVASDPLGDVAAACKASAEW